MARVKIIIAGLIDFYKGTHGRERGGRRETNKSLGHRWEWSHFLLHQIASWPAKRFSVRDSVRRAKRAEREIKKISTVNCIRRLTSFRELPVKRETGAKNERKNHDSNSRQLRFQYTIRN